MSLSNKRNDDAFKFKLNGAEFWCQFLVTNNEDADKAYESTQGLMLTQTSILQLDIDESLLEPFTTGSITINNPFDYFDENHNVDGTGKDYLHIRFYDYVDQENPNLDKVKLEYTFVITSESNSVSKTDRSNNFKTFKLIDYNYYKLNQQVPYDVCFPNSDTDKLIGDIIKDEILKEVLGEDIIDDLNWDSGSHTLNKTQGNNLVSNMQRVRCGVNWKYSDVLKYLLRFNYVETSNGLPVQTILQFDRSIKKYTLKPLNVYFNSNEDLTTEAFALGDLTHAPSKMDSSYATTANKNNPFSNDSIKFNEYSGTLKNTELSTPYTFYTNSYFTNYMVSTYDKFTGVNAVTKITIEETKKLWEEDFIRSFKLLGGEAKSYLNFNSNANRPIKNYSIPQFDRDDSISIVKAQMVSNLTFYNLQLNFSLLGDTARKPGIFLDIVKFSEEENKLDGKLLGKWFVTNVHHKFIRSRYQNHITCIKPYIGPDIDRRGDDASLDPNLLEQQMRQPTGSGLDLPGGGNYGSAYV